MQEAARLAGALCVALWLAGAMALAGSAAPADGPAAKSDKLVVVPEKSDLLLRKHSPDGPIAKGARGAAEERSSARRGSPARKLIDVAIRPDGLWLNSFETRSMPLDAQACAEISEEIVARLALPVNAVQRLADEDLMQQTRVCALNGSLLLTCYAGTATVSLRRANPDDGCSH